MHEKGKWELKRAVSGAKLLKGKLLNGAFGIEIKSQQVVNDLKNMII